MRVRRGIILGLAGLGLVAASFLGGCGGGDSPTVPPKTGHATSPTSDPTSSDVRRNGDQSPAVGPASGRTASVPEAATATAPRIVSLSPAISRTLVDLGLGDAIVARTPYCDSVPASIPVAGTHLDFDAERIVSVAPTHLFVQAPAQGVDPALSALAAERGIALTAWKLERVQDVAALVRSLPDAIGGAAGERARPAAVARADALDALDRRAAAVPATAPRALLLVTTDPLGAAGAGTFLDDLARAAGWRNAVTHSGYPSLSHEDLVRLDPDLVVVVRDTSERDDATLRAQVLATDALLARYGASFRVVRDPDALLPSSALVDVAKKLAESPR
ncbi:MAG: ABC transporter substrate-binding protein [Phycisphaerae bacterium]|nr:ABC transporter substrate-binding protein [Phycisphaerae bacterium]